MTSKAWQGNMSVAIARVRVIATLPNLLDSRKDIY